MKPVESDRLDAEERRELSSSDFGIPEERAFPMPDAAHVRAAEAYFRYASDDQKPELARNILEKAAEYGVRVESPVVLSWAGQLRVGAAERRDDSDDQSDQHIDADREVDQLPGRNPPREPSVQDREREAQEL